MLLPLNRSWISSAMLDITLVHVKDLSKNWTILLEHINHNVCSDCSIRVHQCFYENTLACYVATYNLGLLVRPIHG